MLPYRRGAQGPWQHYLRSRGRVPRRGHRGGCRAGHGGCGEWAGARDRSRRPSDPCGSRRADSTGRRRCRPGGAGRRSCCSGWSGCC